MGSVVARHVAHGKDTDLPGEFAYVVGGSPASVCGMIIACPRCGARRFISFAGDGGPWTWDENEQKPTLHPSVHATECCGWHGYLRAGVWEEA